MAIELRAKFDPVQLHRERAFVPQLSVILISQILAMDQFNDTDARFTRRVHDMNQLFVSLWMHIAERMRSQREGQAMVEYSIILLLVVIACIAIVTQLGGVVKNELYAALESLPLGV